jgi:hypothetical protein
MAVKVSPLDHRKESSRGEGNGMLVINYGELNWALDIGLKALHAPFIDIHQKRQTLE